MESNTHGNSVIQIRSIGSRNLSRNKTDDLCNNGVEYRLHLMTVCRLGLRYNRGEFGALLFQDNFAIHNSFAFVGLQVVNPMIYV